MWISDGRRFYFAAQRFVAGRRRPRTRRIVRVSPRALFLHWTADDRAPFGIRPGTLSGGNRYTLSPMSADSSNSPAAGTTGSSSESSLSGLHRMAWRYATASGLAGIAFSVGCQAPIQPDSSKQLRESVEAAIRQRIDIIPAEEGMKPVTRAPVALEEQLASRRGELEALGPPRDIGPGSLAIGTDLFGAEQQEVTLSLQTAVASAVKNNLATQQAILAPAITEAEVEAAAAVFDAVLFGSTQLNVTDQPRPLPVLNGFALGSGVSTSRSWAFETGVRKPLESGGAFTVSTDLSRVRDNDPSIDFLPDPAWSSAVRLGYAQPLLRGFGSDVNTATIKLARNAERGAVEDLRQSLLQLVLEVEASYWNLVVAREELRIRMWLTTSGEQVRDVLARRREFDTRQSQFSDAVATVEQRKASVLRAQRNVRAASDRLKTLMNDPGMPLESEVLLAPIDFMVESPVNIDLREAMLTALESRPEISRALLAVDDASIRQLVADNARLPVLDLTAQLGWFGLSDSASDAYAELGEGSFIDSLLGANLSQPIGNREAEASFRAARLRRSSAVIGFRRTVQDVTLEVKNALRDCLTNFELISATRSSRLAAAENLRALLVEEKTLAGLTPEFLNLKFQRQDRLALAQFEEYQSLSAYNTAVASLYRALGTGLEMNRIDVDVESMVNERREP